jgi:hypothetical protein
MAKGLHRRAVLALYLFRMLAHAHVVLVIP